MSFTLQNNELDALPRLRSGEPVAEAVGAVAQLGVAAVLFNCGQPEAIGAVG